MRAEIVAVGTELLIGQIANTNAQWISERLAGLGIDVLHHQVVGDNADRIVDAISLAASRSDVVIVTGGLGPTQDDVTRQALAEAAGARLVRHAEIEDALRDRFRLMLGVPSVAMLQAAETASSFKLDESSFRCMREMTPVRHFYVDNLAGNLEGTLAVANAPEGKTYPTGSVVQLVPTEVMVKRDPGFSPVTGDWEFFELEVSGNGSKIHKRGFADVNNRFDKNCFGCHVPAREKWAFIC